jgi:hypothetical protein
MCHCEEERRSNLLVFARFLSLNSLQLLNLLIISAYFGERIASQITDCFVVPPRKDTLIWCFRVVQKLSNVELMLFSQHRFV